MASFHVLTTAVAVCRECLPGYDVNSLSHVVRLLDEYLNTFSPNWTVPRACNAGLSRRALDYLATRDPDWGGGHDVAYVAVKKGYLHVLQWLNERYPHRTSWGSRHGRCLLNTAAEHRRLSVLQWLRAKRSEKCTAFAMSIAASNGDLAMMQWSHKNRREGCTKQATDDAAENGHLAVVKWLDGNRREGCTEDAMDDAAGNGHLEVVRFLHENRREGCTSAAMNLAAAHGHLEVVKWLLDNRREGQPGTALRFAAENGRLAVVEWLYDEVRQQRRSESCIRGAVRAAMEAGHAEVARELEQRLKRQRHE